MKDEYCLSGRIERKRYKEAADKNWEKSSLSRPKAKFKPLKYFETDEKNNQKTTASSIGCCGKANVHCSNATS